jgi:nitrite reductase (NO-forming)
MGARRSTRVIESHAIARLAFRLGGIFALVAVSWAAIVLIRGGSWWGPLHSFLAGTVLMAISGAAQMFTITWASAPAPSRALATFQRWAVAGGTALVLVGVAGRVDALTWIGASAVAAGLVALTVSIVGAVRRSLLRRFDLSARFYVTAFTSGVAGIALGAVLGSGTVGDQVVSARLVHSHLNLLGLVGLTIIGTLPTFLPTTAHHRAVSGREALVSWWLAVTGVIAIAAGLWAPAALVGIGNLLVAASALLVLIGILSRLWEKGSGRLPFIQVSLGVAWLTAWAIFDGVGIMQSGASPVFGGWAGAAVIAGIGQVLAGSLGYIVPVLLGPPLSPTESILTRRRWVPLILVNLGGLALAAGWELVAVTAVALWLLDVLIRAVTLVRSRHGPR